MMLAIFMTLGLYAAPKSNLPHLEWGVDKITAYQHEPVTVTLYLWAPEANVRDIREIQPGKLDKGEFSFISHADFDRRPMRKVLDGREWIVYPVDSYIVTLDRPGKHRLSGGRYAVEASVPTIVEDPFWGKMQAYKSETTEIGVSPVQFDIKSLPANDDDSFSGAVGDFQVEVTVPPGDIYVDEEALAVITVKGEGWINDHILPEYREAFGSGTKLKSFSESRNKYLENGKMVSEVQMECTFIPTLLKGAVIGPVKIRYFNPATNSYETAESNEVVVKVRSVADKAPAIDI